MTKKNKADKEKRAALRQKRREKRRNDDDLYDYGKIMSDFAKADRELEELKDESAAKRWKSFKITVVAFFAICFAGLAWARIDACLYTKVGATITDSYVVKGQIPIFGSRYSVGGSMPYYEEWAKVEYTFNNVEYISRVRLTKDVSSSRVTILCKRSNPKVCRMTRLKYPLLDLFIIGAAGFFLIVGLGAWYIPDEKRLLLVLYHVFFLALLVLYLWHRYLNI